MSFSAIRIVWEAQLKPTAIKLLVLALADWCDDSGGRLFPSMAAVGLKIGVSRSQAQRLMRTLIEAELLTVVGNAHGGKPGTTPHYQLNLDRIAVLPKTGSAGATGSTDAIPTGNAEATPTGSTNAMGGVAPMRPRGSIDATLTLIEPLLNQESGARKRAARNCPSSFAITAALETWAHDENPGVDLTAETDKFRDHTFKNPITDWQGAWRNWIRRAGKFAGQQASQSNPMPDTDVKPAWALRAGFSNRYEAENAGCFEHNADAFSNGTRKEYA